MSRFKNYIRIVKIYTLFNIIFCPQTSLIFAFESNSDVFMASDSLSILLNNLDEDNYHSIFNKLIEVKESQGMETLLKDDVYKKIFDFTKLALEDNISVKSFNIFYETVNLYSNCAECLENLNTVFSNYFVKDIGNSLHVLKSFDEPKQSFFVKSSLFTEGNADLILCYIINSRLENNPYFNLYLKFR